MSKLFDWLLVPLLLLAVGRLAAVEPPPNPAVADELKQLNDRTILNTYLSWESEWNQFKHGEEKAVWTLSGLWGWSASDWQDWGVRFKLPFAYRRSDQPSDHADVGGIGDGEIGAGTAFRLSRAWRTAGGIELHADTASDSALAEKVLRLKSGWGVAHDFSHWLTVTLNADYNHSIAERDGVPPQRYFELSLPATLILPQAWSIHAQYKTTVDFENDDRWSHRISAGIAKRLSKIPVVLSATLEKPLSSSAEKFRVSVTIVYYFQRYHSPR